MTICNRIKIIMVILKVRYECIDKLGNNHRPYLLFYNDPLEHDSEFIRETIECLSELYPIVTCLKVNWQEYKTILKKRKVSLYGVILIEWGKSNKVITFPHKENLIRAFEYLTKQTEQYFVKQKSFSGMPRKTDFQCSTYSVIQEDIIHAPLKDGEYINMKVLRPKVSDLESEKLLSHSSPPKSSSFITNKNFTHLKCKEKHNNIPQKISTDSKSPISNCVGHFNNNDQRRSSLINQVKPFSLTTSNFIEDLKIKALTLTENFSLLRNRFSNFNSFNAQKNYQYPRVKFTALTGEVEDVTKKLFQ